MELLGTREYYNNVVSSGLFYAMENEFYSIPYTIPKGILGKRQYWFLSYPLTALYHAIGVYILRLVSHYVERHRKSDSISSFYGGHLQLINGSRWPRLKVKHVNYKVHYRSYKQVVAKRLKISNSSTFVVKTDLQSYYESIDIRTLCREIEPRIRFKDQSKLKFHADTQDALVELVSFITHYQGGIPQFDNDLVSNFLAYVYMCFGDDIIEEEVKKGDFSWTDFHLCRYTDDMFLFLDFDDSISIANAESALLSLLQRISDRLFNELGLRINTSKTFFWNTVNDEVKKEIAESLKQTSREDEDYIRDENSIQPEELAKMLLTSFRSLGNSRVAKDLGRITSKQNELFKSVYDDDIREILQTEWAQQFLTSIFNEEFDFSRCADAPKTSAVLIAQSEIARQRFAEFYRTQRTLSTPESFLIQQYLCQVRFASESTELLKSLATHPDYEKIVGKFTADNISWQAPGYCNCSREAISLIASQHLLIEQIRLRRWSEAKGIYSVALNHLINELQLTCEFVSSNECTKAADIDNVLNRCEFPSGKTTVISNLYSRRHGNTVSHPHTAGEDGQGVKQKEFIDARNIVVEATRYLLEGHPWSAFSLEQPEGLSNLDK